MTQPVLSLLNLVSIILVLWSLNPESIFYDWKIWAAAAGIWTVLALSLTGKRLFKLIIQYHLWLIAIWPAYSLLLWATDYGQIHRKFIAIAFMMAVPLFYLAKGWRKELSGLAMIGAVYLGVIAATTLVQMISYPAIARDLAVGRGTGNIRASALLGNFHTVYEAVLLSLTLAGLLIVSKKWKNNQGWILLAVSNFLLIGFAQYDIAILSLLIGFIFILMFRLGLHRPRKGTMVWWERESKKDWIRETTLTSLIYSLPALSILALKAPIDQFIDLLDYKKIEISTKLFDRIWIYLRSVFLFLQFPVVGFGVQPNRTEFMVGQHSDYLDLLAEYGLIGFLFFLLPWIALLLWVRNQLAVGHRGIYWVSVVVFHIIFMLNPILEVSAITMLFLILPGIIIGFESPPATNDNGGSDEVLQ